MCASLIFWTMRTADTTKMSSFPLLYSVLNKDCARMRTRQAVEQEVAFFLLGGDSRRLVCIGSSEDPSQLLMVGNGNNNEQKWHFADTTPRITI